MLKASWKLTMVVCLVAGLVGASLACAGDAPTRPATRQTTMVSFQLALSMSCLPGW